MLSDLHHTSKQIARCSSEDIQSFTGLREKKCRGQTSLIAPSLLTHSDLISLEGRWESRGVEFNSQIEPTQIRKAAFRTAAGRKSGHVDSFMDKGHYANLFEKKKLKTKSISLCFTPPTFQLFHADGLPLHGLANKQ